MREFGQPAPVQTAAEVSASLTMPLMTLGDIVSHFRTQRGLRQVDLAKSSGISRATLQRLEKGRYFPHGSTFERLIPAFGFEPGSFEIDLLRRQYGLEKEKRDFIQAPLEEYLRQHPNEPVNFSRIARAFCTDPAAIAERYRALLAKDLKLPPLAKDKDIVEARRERVKTFIRAGWKISQLPELLDIPKSVVYRIAREMKPSGEFSAPETKPPIQVFPEVPAAAD